MRIFRLGSDVGSEHVCVVGCVRNTSSEACRNLWVEYFLESGLYVYSALGCYLCLFRNFIKFLASRVVQLVEVLTCILEVSGSSIWLCTDFHCYYSAPGS
jgi:hypothetical protein